jgi:hypothetical protein
MMKKSEKMCSSKKSMMMNKKMEGPKKGTKTLMKVKKK